MQPTAATLIEVVEWEPALLRTIANKLVAELSFDMLHTVFERLTSQPYSVQGRRKKLRPSFLAVAQELPSLFDNIRVLCRLGMGDSLVARLFHDYSTLYVDRVIPPLRQHGTKRNLAHTAMFMFNSLSGPVAMLSLDSDSDVLPCLESISRMVIAMTDCLLERQVKSTTAARTARMLLGRYLHFVTLVSDSQSIIDQVIHLLAKYALRMGSISVVESFSTLTTLPADVIEKCVLDCLEEPPCRIRDPLYAVLLRTLALLPNAPGHVKAAVELTLVNL